MKRVLHIHLLVIALLLYSTAMGQKLKYDILLFGKKIGETTVEMKDSSGIKHYILHSNSEVKMLFMNKKSDMCTDVLFGKDGVMSCSTFENIKEDGKIFTKAVWDKSKLLVDKNGEKVTLSNAVNYSSILLYFSEPTHLQKVFSERLGEFFQINKEAQGKYTAQTKSGTATYIYSNGKLTDLEMKSTLGSVFLKLTN